MSISSSAIDAGVRNAMNAGGGASKGAGADLQDSFMTLLVTQLKNQDPMNPMDNAEMTSQLAQINTVTGIQELNDTLAEITGQIDAGQALQAVGLIGKGVLVPGNRLLVGEEGSSTPFGIELGRAAEEVKVTITDGSGRVVRSFELGALDAGVQSFSWDGLLEDGSSAPEGAYRVAVDARSSGKSQDALTLNYALVNGVSTSPDQGPRLDLGGISEQVGLDDIRQIL